jgi:SH3 domain-containing YSC84-like protein 1
MKSTVLAVTAVAVSTISVGAAITPSEVARLAAASTVIHDMGSVVPQPYWDRARCVAVIPDLKKAAFVFGGEYGKGVMSCRSGDGWSAPVFTQLAKGSWGFQAGAEQVDLVLLVMNDSGVQKLLQNKVTLGADASVAAGPIGRQGSVGTDAALTAEILAYSRAKGLFAGIDISGGVLRPDEEANRDVYGSSASPRTILASREIAAPPEAREFLSAIASVSTATSTVGAAGTEPATASAGQTHSTAPRSRGSSSSATASTAPPPQTPNDRDLRARIAEIQQTLDRLLTSTGNSTVGTTGTTNDTGDMVTIDRASLARLRQQVEALAAAIERR